MAVNILIMIYKSRFTKFHYESREIDYLKGYCKVKILDLSELLKEKKEIQRKKIDTDEVLEIKSFLDLNKYFKTTYSQKKNIYVINFIEYPESIKDIIFFCILRYYKYKSNFILIRNNNPGHIREEKLLGNSNPVIRVLKTSTSSKELYLRMKSFTYGLLLKIIRCKEDYEFLAGSDWDISEKNNKVKKIYGHSIDYSRHLREPPRILQRKKNYAVFLDNPSPNQIGDASLSGWKIYATGQKYYPSLRNFFDYIEYNFDINILISGHIKTEYPVKLEIFGNRNIIYGETKDLIYNSIMILNRASTAVGYAMLYSKPIIYLYSDEIKNDIHDMNTINNFQLATGGDIVNIDDYQTWPKFIPDINLDKSEEYIRRCMSTCKNKGPNYKVFIKEIMGN